MDNTKDKWGWYVLYVKSRHEKKVHRILLENGVTSFLPLFKTIRKWSDRKKKVELPLFPSYVLVNISANKDFEKILSVEGACGFIQFGRAYAKVTEAEIRNIKLLLNIEGLDEVKVSCPSPIIGAQYKILHGPLRGLDCEIEKIDKKEKITVRIHSIQKNITAVLPRHSISEFAVMDLH